MSTMTLALGLIAAILLGVVAVVTLGGTVGLIAAVVAAAPTAYFFYNRRD